MERIRLPKIKSELLQPMMTRPDWTKSASRSNLLLQLDKNENTDDIYIAFLKSIISTACFEEINSYPDCAILYNKLARDLNISTNQLLLGAGSDGIIRYAFETFVSKGDAVVYTEPSFAMYSVYSDMFGAKSCCVGYQKKENELLLDVDLFLQMIADNHPTLVCLPNPDSPTGTLVSEEQLILIIEAAQKVNAAVLIDEAYYPFSEYTALPLLSSYSNLIIARTFSKAWGLAGARVGYAISNPELIRYMHKVRPMYELGALSVAIVAQVLDYKNEMLASVSRLNAGKDYFKNEMQRMGLKTLFSAGNFQHVAFGPHASDIHARLSNFVLYRQNFPGTVLDGFSRFSATTVPSFKKIVHQIDSVLQHNLQTT